MYTDPVAVVERYLQEVLSGGRPESASALIASDALQKRTAALRSAFPDLRVTVVKLIATADTVAVQLAGSGTQTGPFQGIPPTGRTFSASCTALYEVRGGRITGSWVTWDLLGILEQLGAVRRTAVASA